MEAQRKSKSGRVRLSVAGGGRKIFVVAQNNIGSRLELSLRQEEDPDLLAVYLSRIRDTMVLRVQDGFTPSMLKSLSFLTSGRKCSV